MLSYTARRNSFQDLTNASDSSTLSLGDRLMNQSEKRILTSMDWPFLEGLDTSLVTGASTQAYNLPNVVSKPKSIYVVVGSQRYTPVEVTNRSDWDRLNQISYTSDYVEYYYVFNRQILLFPVPTTASNTIGIIYRKTPKDLTIADYTTGTIVSVANAGTAVVGSGTTWAVSMAGRYLQITESNTANKGDGYWYPITSSASTTTITLSLPYTGTAISAGAAAYTIGQMSLLPEGYTDLPIFDAVRQYFSTIQPEPTQAQLYDKMYKELWAQMVVDQASKSTDPVLDDGLDTPLKDPNLYYSL